VILITALGIKGWFDEGYVIQEEVLIRPWQGAGGALPSFKNQERFEA